MYPQVEHKGSSYALARGANSARLAGLEGAGPKGWIQTLPRGRGESMLSCDGEGRQELCRLLIREAVAQDEIV